MREVQVSIDTYLSVESATSAHSLVAVQYSIPEMSVRPFTEQSARLSRVAKACVLIDVNCNLWGGFRRISRMVCYNCLSLLSSNFF